MSTQGVNEMSNIGDHEPVEELSGETRDMHRALASLAETRDMHRALASLMEELEAVDWYNQRAQTCADPELKAIIEHNRDEGKEQASMLLEWIRRNDPRFSAELKDYVFMEKSIVGTGRG